jgi:ribose transport system substrate-binding protein
MSAGKSGKPIRMRRLLAHLKVGVRALLGLAWLLPGTAAVALLSCGRAVPTIAVVPRTCGTLLWEAEHTGVERVARKIGYNVYWNAPMREDDVQGQIDLLTHALAKDPGGLIISPVEALPLRSPIHRALERGFPIVVVGTDLGLQPGRNLAYVLSDERAGGQMAARRIGALLHGQGSVAVIGINKQLTSTAERSRSLEASLNEEFPRIRVTFRSMALPTVAQEQQTAEHLLADNPQPDAIVALNEISTRGAYYALTEFNKTKTIRLVGFDQNLLAPIRTGGIDSIIFQNTYQMGQAAMSLMQEELHGGAKHDYVSLQPQLVTRENMDSDAAKQLCDLSWFN